MTMRKNGSAIEVNGRRYAVPKLPTVVICVDGCEPDYIAQAVAGGKEPASVDRPGSYRVRAGGIVANENADFEAVMIERFGRADGAAG